MKRLLLTLTLVLTFVVQLTPVAGADEAPLTLLEQPAKSSVNGASQPQMPPIPQPGQMAQGAGQQMAMYDIYGVVPTSVAIPYRYIGLGILVLLLILALVYWLYKRNRRPGAVPIIPPWERALTDLTEARTLFAVGQGRDYMDRVSQILRRYVEERFAIQSTRQTTREFLRSLKNTEESEINSYKMELQHCLEQADMAKFAHKVQDEENLSGMEEAVSTFVHATSPSGQPLEEPK